jgi:hypothetical protein
MLLPHNKQRCDYVLFNPTGILLVLEVHVQLLGQYDRHQLFLEISWLKSPNKVTDCIQVLKSQRCD